MGFNNIVYSTAIPLQFNADSGMAKPTMSNLSIVGGAGITTTASGDTITLSTSGSGFGWTVVTSASNPITLTPENGYICKGAGVVNFILPAAASIGDVYYIKGYGNLWTIAQNAFQFITLGIAASTLGVGGSVSATQIKDSVELLCVTANNEFDIVTSVGNPTII